MFEKTELVVDIFRHAEAVNNMAPHLISGRSAEAPLTSKGLIQAQRLNARLIREGISYDNVYVSPILRVKTTAAIAIAGIYPRSPIEVPQLEELSQGDWEGVPRAKVYDLETLNRMNSHNPNFIPPNGESLRMVERRISNWFEDEVLYNPKFQESDSRVAIFSSGQAIRCFLHYVMGFESRFMFRMATENTALTRLKYNSGGWWVDKFNDTAHLYEPYSN